MSSFVFGLESHREPLTRYGNAFAITAVTAAIAPSAAVAPTNCAAKIPNKLRVHYQLLCLRFLNVISYILYQ